MACSKCQGLTCKAFIKYGWQISYVLDHEDTRGYSAQHMSVDWEKQLQLLKEYQDHNLRLISLQKRLDELKQQSLEIHNRTKTVENELADRESANLALARDRKGVERDIAVAREQVKDRESKLHSIKNNKEYQASLKEIAEAKRLLRDLEDRALQLMGQGEELDEEIKQLSLKVTDIHNVCKEELKVLEAESERISSEQRLVKEDLRRREEAIDPAAMRIYHRIQRGCQDAIAVVAGPRCSGCNMKIQPQRMLELRRASRLVTCESCTRLLYYDEDAALAETAVKTED